MSLFGKVMQFFGFTESGKSSKDVTGKSSKDVTDVLQTTDDLQTQPVPAQVVIPLTLDTTAKNIRENLKEAKKIKNVPDTIVATDTPDTPDPRDAKIKNVNAKQKKLRDNSKKCSSDINNIIDKVTSFP